MEPISLLLLNYFFLVKSNFLFHKCVTSCHYKHIHAVGIYKPAQSHKSCFGVRILQNCPKSNPNPNPNLSKTIPKPSLSRTIPKPYQNPVKVMATLNLTLTTSRMRAWQFAVDASCQPPENAPAPSVKLVSLM